jgi:hypothetical protein
MKTTCPETSQPATEPKASKEATMDPSTEARDATIDKTVDYEDQERDGLNDAHCNLVVPADEIDDGQRNKEINLEVMLEREMGEMGKKHGLLQEKVDALRSQVDGLRNQTTSGRAKLTACATMSGACNAKFIT